MTRPRLRRRCPPSGVARSATINSYTDARVYEERHDLHHAGERERSRRDLFGDSRRPAVVIAQLFSFAALAAVLVAIPGPAVLLIMKSVMLHGRRQALLTALGVYGGDLVWVVSSAVGLTAVLVASRPAFETLRYLGAAYLLYLGLRLLLARTQTADGPDELPFVSSVRRSNRRAFRLYDPPNASIRPVDPG